MGVTNLEQARKEVADKVEAIENKAASVFYRDNNSINTIEKGNELISLVGQSSVASKRTNTNSKNPIRNITAGTSINSSLDDRLVVSSITWETILSKQS